MKIEGKILCKKNSKKILLITSTRRSNEAPAENKCKKTKSKTKFA